MKKRTHLFLSLPILLLLATVVILLSLPYLLDLYLFPRLVAELPFSTKEISLSRITPWKIRGTLTLAGEKSSSLNIPKFEIRYSPASLIKGRVHSILLDSMAIKLKIQNGKVIFPGDSPQKTNSDKDNKDFSLLSPVALQTIILKNCSITWKMKQQPVTIQMNGHLLFNFNHLNEKQKLLTELAGELALSGALNLASKIDIKAIEENRFHSQLAFKTDNIGQLQNFLPGMKKFQLSGGLALTAQAQLAPFEGEFDNFTAKIELPNFHLAQDSFTLEAISLDDPVTLNLKGEQQNVHYSLKNIALIQPEQLALTMQGDLALATKNLLGSGQLTLPRTDSVIDLNYQGSISPEGGKLRYQLAGSPISLSNFLSVSPYSAEGIIVQNNSELKGNIQLNLKEIKLPNNEISLHNLSLKLPWQYPLQKTTGREANKKTKTATININKILYKGQNSGRLRINFQPTADEVHFTTLLTSPFMPGMRLSCTGKSGMTGESSVRCDIPATDFDLTTLPAFISVPEELSVHGKLSSSATFQMTDKIPSGTLQVDFQQGVLSHGENRLSDINIGIHFPNLPLLQSSPSQRCTIGSLELGKIKLSDALIHFRIENNQSIFLERSRLNWCGGKVETGSFRLETEMEELETTFYCDRLGFTELLNQFGVEQTEGQGTLNGRLPIQISKRGLVFDDGFLFSTPGKSGIIRFNDTKQLRQGIPDISQSAYLDYSMTALENFSYNWTKLSFNSIENDLLIAMQLDGKPEKPLPYGYQKGQIVPTTKGPGLQHPIRLDVNFRLPMQDLFQYGQNIQSIMENM